MLLLKNATVLTMDEPQVIEHGDVLIDGGKIAAVGTDLAQEGCEVIDLTGRIVMPGLVDAHAHRSNFPVSGEGSGDINELTNPVTAELNALYAIDPKNESFRISCAYGITTSCIAPGSGNVVGGWCVAIKSAGGDLASRVIANPVALKAAMGINPKGVYSGKNRMPMTRMGIAQVLRDYLRRVQAYMKKKEAADGDPEKLPPYDEALEHGIPVLRREIPLKVHAYQQDMMTVLAIADEFDIDVTLDHALGASDFVEEMAASRHLRGVIYGPVYIGLFPGEGCKVDFDAMKLLDDRGVCTAMMTDALLSGAQMLVNQVGECVRAGMEPMRALRMMTVNPARMLGLDSRIGRLAPGMDADIAVFSAMPCVAPAAEVLMMLIDGQIVYQKNMEG